MSSKFLSLLFLLAIQSLMSCKTLSLKPENTEGKIITINSMEEIDPSIKNADLVIFDIDHTILEATTRYCHSNWFYDHYDDALSQGIAKERVLKALVGPWESSQLDCPVKAVEDKTLTIIKAMQARKQKVMALTARSKNIADATIAQLESLGLDFGPSAPLAYDFVSEQGSAQKKGVLFASDYLTKGEVLKAYLAKADFKPKRIVFVDDVMHNLVSVKDTFKDEGLQIDAFFYPRVKRGPAEWDKSLADQEWELHHGPIVY